MRVHSSDFTWSCLGAFVLLGLAMFAVFKVPHGFEEQVGWYLLLLPGAIFAAAISEFLGKVVPREQALVFKGLLVGFNFIWYFVITYAAIRTYRFVSGLKTSRGE